MKAIGYKDSSPISHEDSLCNIELPMPSAQGHDILVKVSAISVNPVDTKIRKNVAPEGDNYKVIGWDAVGVVSAVGEKVTKFKAGDSVYYAGDLTRSGSNAQYQLVDERIVGHKPKSLSDAEAAALPLTAITAYELLFEHLAIKKLTPNGAKQSAEQSKNVVLIVGAAGGVGSILIQLVKVLTSATVIATASRQSSQQWVKDLGADYVIDHSKPLQEQVDSLIANEGVGQVTHVASLMGTEAYFETYIDLLAPFGKIAMIDDLENSLNVIKLKFKSLSLHIEFMFARAMFNADDLEEQSHLLNHVAELVDAGHIKTTVGKNLGEITAENLKLAHEEIESATAIGKIVLEGFPD